MSGITVEYMIDGYWLVVDIDSLETVIESIDVELKYKGSRYSKMKGGE